MFRDQEDYNRGFNYFALALYKTGSTGLVESFQSTHSHKMVQTEDPVAFMYTMRQSYAKYFNHKYQRSGRVGEKYHFTLEVTGLHHMLAAMSYILRNALHHGIVPIPYAYPHCSVNAIFQKEMGKRPPERLLDEKHYSRFIGRKAQWPSHYRMSESGVFLRESVLDIPQVENMFGKNRIEVLAAITELRQICGHPSLVLPSYAASSGKMDMLLDILPGALEAGHRALIFSQFTRMLRILQRRLEAVGVECLYLDGETPPKRRMELVDQFNGGRAQVFLISLKAGGMGLNLTAASQVIHYDLWWNPAIEAQATDRAFRIGQTKNVQVHRFITKGTFEEKIDALLEAKKAVAQMTVNAGETWLADMDDKQLGEIFTLDSASAI